MCNFPGANRVADAALVKVEKIVFEGRNFFVVEDVLIFLANKLGNDLGNIGVHLAREDEGVYWQVEKFGVLVVFDLLEIVGGDGVLKFLAADLLLVLELNGA